MTVDELIDKLNRVRWHNLKRLEANQAGTPDEELGAGLRTLRAEVYTELARILEATIDAAVLDVTTSLDAQSSVIASPKMVMHRTSTDIVTLICKADFRMP